VEKDLGPKRREMPRSEFLAKCRMYAQKWIDAQRTGFQRLGVMGAWDEPYVTMAPKYEAEVVRLLGKVPGKTSGYVLAGIEFSLITPFIQGLIEAHVLARSAQQT